MPTNYDIRADQVTPFPLVVDGKPLDVSCAPGDACTYYDFTSQTNVPIAKKENVPWVNWQVIQPSALITITADKVHTYTSNDGKTRTWKFKQLVKNSSTGYDYVSVQYDFVSMTNN